MSSDLAAARASAAPAMQLQQVEALVRSSAAEILGDALPEDGSFSAGQFDSLSAVELANSLSKAVGRTMPGRHLHRLESHIMLTAAIAVSFAAMWLRCTMYLMQTLDAWHAKVLCSSFFCRLGVDADQCTSSTASSNSAAHVHVSDSAPCRCRDLGF